MFLLIHRRKHRRNEFRYIYIPLCFYLYRLSVYGVTDLIEFTFHYVSTYTVRLEAWSRGLSKFTFHYVSTYTVPINAIRQDCLNLHSTMFLLILCTQTRGSICSHRFTFHYVSTYTKSADHPVDVILVIYIPLCFYLYFVVHRIVEPAVPFTFHYVSTYTVTIPNINSRSAIYIPLCFYLY